MSDRFVVPFSRVFAWAEPRPGEQGSRRRGSWATRQRYHRMLFVVIGFWAVVTCAAAALYPPLALVLAAAGLAHVIGGYRVEQKRRTDEQPRPAHRT